jgi:dihydroorotate dehydrogenase
MNSLAFVLRQHHLRSALSQGAISAPQRAAAFGRIPTTAVRHYATVRKEHTTSSRITNFVLGTGLVVGGLVGVSYGFDSRASILKYVFVPLMHWTMDAETAHKVGIKLLSAGISPWDTQEDDPSLEVKVNAREMEGHHMICLMTVSVKSKRRNQHPTDEICT